jgi:hypothetical protein
MRILCLALLAGPLCAQLAITVREGSAERAVTAVHDFGLATPGETREAQFRVRNTGAAAYTLQLLTVDGTGFSLSSAPMLPYVLLPAAAAGLAVRFTPPRNGTHTGSLRLDGLLIELRGSAFAAATLERETPSGWAPVAPPAEIDLGSAGRGGSLRAQFQLANRGPAAVQAGPVSVAGPGFRLEPPWPGVRTLAAGEAAPFSLVASLDQAGPREATLRVDVREFKIKILVREAPLPPLVLTVPETLESGRQERISLRLAGPAPAALEGALSLSFEPAAGGPHDDTGMGLGASLARSAGFRVASGETRAEFSGAADILLQTGATAGTLVLSAAAGEQRTELRRALAPRTVFYDWAEAMRSAQQVDVRLRGFDNTRTAGRLRFTFYLRGGSALAQGPVEADAASQFAAFFKERPASGGAFALSASFPVSGTAAELEAVEVEMFNQAGAAKSGRLTLR